MYQFLNKLYVLITLLCCLSIDPGYTQTSDSTTRAAIMVRTADAPRIDGFFSDEEWADAALLTGFRQYEPVSNANPSFETNVYLLYDDQGIYIAARLFDPSPDSIACQLGQRDNGNLNADYFSIAFDTYNNQQDAYFFMVSASGVQADQRFRDPTYDAVWKSAVKINEEGWLAEIYIPYSALRFPKLPNQTWGFQATRTIRRYREDDLWAMEEKGSSNSLIYWGKLLAFKDLQPPLRLTLTPYVSTSLQHNKYDLSGDNQWNMAYNGGLDLKYGINESFTVDMILLPDFSQVQSDKIQKNLTAFELIYDEKRTFFNEGTDLFQKGDLFYSRRIGRTPLLYYSIYDSLKQGEMMSNNPVAARLLNAVKFSGRTSGGLGIGVFNALTGNTWATIKDSTGKTRQILSDPVTNYNIVVLDQALPNNSSVYFINTNVSRPGSWDRSNVTGTGVSLNDKTKTYRLNASIAISKWFPATGEKSFTYGSQEIGENYALSFLKTRGKFQFSVYYSILDKDFNINDMGINRTRNKTNRGFYTSYRIYEPFSIFRNFSQSFGIDQTRTFDSKKNMNTEFSYNGNTTFNNYFTVWWGIEVSPFDRYDFYEPRVAGRYFLKPGYWSANFGFSSDYRKKFALDGSIDYARDFNQMEWGWIELEPIYRVNNRFHLSLESGYGFNPGDLGYIGHNPEIIYFGQRDVTTFENALAGNYMISRLISVQLTGRHFWQTGEYTGLYQLAVDGTLHEDDELEYDPSFNYNFFSIDFMLGWEFAPGSMLSIVWKNTIQTEDKNYNIAFIDNFNEMIKGPQLNMFSLKAIYHLDYNEFARKGK